MDEYIIEVYDENEDLVAYMDADGTIGGTESELIQEPIDTTDLEPSIGALAWNVKIYYDGSSWVKWCVWRDDEQKVFNDLNGSFLVDTPVPFKLQFKDSENTGSKTYEVVKDGVFLFHENGSWERVK